MAEEKILFLESFYGGSHRCFADDLIRFSRYKFDLHTLPARHWKWRMRGSPYEFFRQIPFRKIEEYSLMFVTGLMDLTTLKGLYHRRKEQGEGGLFPPTLLYMHENQISYPLAPGEKRDFHYGLTDLGNCLSADRVLFNSRTHLNEFFRLLPSFTKRFPDFQPSWAVEELRRKSSVLYPGVDVSAETEPKGHNDGRPPLIVWNHRWEHDKNPEPFFRALFRLAEQGLSFELALLGENFSKAPPIFSEAKGRLSDKIVQWGYLESREEYLGLLGRGDIVVSTALQENFGISVVEAVLSGCRPLLPCRLSYPELIPEGFHDPVFYRSDEELYPRLHSLLEDPPSIPLPGLPEAMDIFHWKNRIFLYDELTEKVIHSGFP